MKVISFSLWGDNPKYTIGAIRNAELTQIIYPSWVSRFYVGESVPRDIIGKLLTIPNTETIHIDQENNWTSMFWRFSASYDPSVDIVIFRDTDSRLSDREKYAVDAWINSDKTFHIMRDHPHHRFPILGGMWGYKNNHKYDMKTLLDNFKASDRYGTDYEFLANILYPIIEEDKLVHDEFFDLKSFPKNRQGSEFVGDVFDEHNNRHPEYQKLIKDSRIE